ncbi:zinc ribbon domain-containing protein [Catellatospora tritici]|uniref:zinc ribbon domain-containing protein n=1 Tax=Catellatospora tritici TaxID=2851566 RepID=UPI001C2D71B0|nr:zinc ribbon domain-containing protein [Catellatospora tritici]MBV1856701.1 zinc ribbon domain-containing protein [Catellatospora tritici]
MDRKRNPHRPGIAWRQRTVAAIVANPRYTRPPGVEPAAHHRYPTDGIIPGVAGVRKLAPSQGWAISDKPAHEALVTEVDFVAAQKISARTQPVDGSHTYLLVGLLRCGACGRSMDPQSSHGNPAYRCRHGHTSAHTAGMRQARNLYLREDVIIGRILAQMRTLTSRDAGIKEDIARLQQNRNTVELIAFLRAQNMMIECHTASAWLEPDQTKSITISTPTKAAKRERRAPRQRNQQNKQERGIV